MVIKRKTKNLKLEIKNLETDLLKTYKKICDIYEKKYHLDEKELRSEIDDLIKTAEISIIDEVVGYDEFYTSSKGEENKVNRKAFVDKYGNCIVQGYRETNDD